jgi:glycosyltransferase involved in cell wall biosynthesis
MKRTILSVAYPLTEVGTHAVGGSEQILTALDSALTAEGHQSLVIAAEGSKIRGTLIASPAAPKRLNDGVREAARETHRRLIRETLKKYPVDLVHMHSLDFHCYVPAGDVPVLATLHLPPDWYPRKIFGKRGRFLMNCVSRSQLRQCPASPRMLEPVPNGVDVDKLYADVPKRNFALSMGRICPEKGFHFALDAARRAKTKLLLAGEIFPYKSHLEYYRREIAPRLDRERRFVGPLRFAAKRRLLSQARCLIIPSTVAETSSLVAMEAMACGTPVIAFGSGALPEIVDHGRTGFIVSNVEEMGEALRTVESIAPETCRRVARSRFSVRTMEARYLALYDRLIAREARRNSSELARPICRWAAAF